MSSAGAALRAAVPISSARAEASRKNGAKSCGPKTPEGKARSAQNALKHGMRAQKYVVLPEEDAAGFAALKAALTDELAPEGVLQRILVGRIARAAWRLERAERIEVDLFAERLRAIRDGGVGLALIRDGNSTRSFETLLRYRGAALAEFMRSLRSLKALQAGQAAPVEDFSAALALAAAGARPRDAGNAITSSRTEPTRAPRALRLDHAMPDPPAPARTLHEAAAPWTPGRADPEHLPDPPELDPVRTPRATERQRQTNRS